MTFVLVPGFGFDYSQAPHYGWRHSVHIGYWLIFWGKMTAAELEAVHEKRVAK